MYTPEQIEAVWQKAQIIPDNNPNIFRQDYAGAWIRRDQFGKTTDYGWVIDHVVPRSKGGTDSLENLLPLHYLNNIKKGDSYPQWQTGVVADGIKNVESIRDWTIKS